MNLWIFECCEAIYICNIYMYEASEMWNVSTFVHSCFSKYPAGRAKGKQMNSTYDERVWALKRSYSFTFAHKIRNTSIQELRDTIIHKHCLGHHITERIFHYCHYCAIHSSNFHENHCKPLLLFYCWCVRALFCRNSSIKSQTRLWLTAMESVSSWASFEHVYVCACAVFACLYASECMFIGVFKLKYGIKFHCHRSSV